MRLEVCEMAPRDLNRIMELELAGVVRYTHYSLMVFGYHRIPIVEWMKSNAQEGLTHANRAGELVTLLGGHPSLKIGTLLDQFPPNECAAFISHVGYGQPNPETL